jgi:exopolysaccharide biosynthesis protein/predicted phosphodiesterase
MKGMNSLMAILMAGSLFMQPVSVLGEGTDEAEKSEILKSEMISSGIIHTEKQVENFGGSPGNSQRMNVLEADLTNPNVSVITSKALEKVVASESLPSQASREEFKGKDIVAGTNGDMFNMQTGINMTLQVKNSNLLINHSYPSHIPLFPVFAVDKNKKAFIDEVEMRGMLTFDGKSVNVDTLNRNENAGEKLGIYTHQLNQKGQLTFDDRNQTFINNGAIAVVRKVENLESIKAGQAYTGKIEKIFSSYETMDIPEDGIIIAGFGSKADLIRNELKEGMNISFQFDIFAGENRVLKNDITEATGGYNWLVKDGKALTKEELVSKYGNHVLLKSARTAIGITADQKVISMTIDKPSTHFDKSKGVTLVEMAVLMEKQGAVAALGLDGGGSTEMIVQPKGKSALETANHPGDGYSRSITNGILFVNHAEKTGEIGEVVVERDITIFKNAAFPFGVKATDNNGNPVSIASRSVTWGASKGTIDKTGLYKAPDLAGTDKVEAVINGKSGQASVTVIDQVDEFHFTDGGPVILQPGEEKKLEVTARKDGKDVVLTGDAIEWKMAQEYGEISADGTIKVREDVPAGTRTTVSAKLGTIEKQIELLIGLKEQVVDDFETYPNEGYEVTGYMGGTHQLSTEQAKLGETSLRVDYDSKKWTRKYNGTINVVPHWYRSSAGKWPDELADSMYETYKTDIRPKKFGVWVYGDGKAPWARLIFKANNVNKTLDLAPKVDWIGWKYLEAELPQDWALPIVFNYLYFVETNKNIPDYSGTVFLDQMRFIYSSETEDFNGPEFKEVTPSGNMVYENKITFSSLLIDQESGVDADSIEVKLNGEKIPHIYQADTGRVEASAENLSEGIYHLTASARDTSGNISVPAVDKKITIDLSEDTEEPVLSNVTPTGKAIEKTDEPRITFKLRDEKSGVKRGSTSVKIDGHSASVHYDEKTGWAYALPEKPLKNGKHSFMIEAKDNSGNVMTPYVKEFETQVLKQPEKANQFNITILPDTQGFTYSKRLFERAKNEDSDFVMHVGDIVDTSSEAEWNRAKEDINLLSGKLFFATPGNHESFQGNIDYYSNIIGSPTYHFEYGNTLVVSLNSAFGQSISASDSTQFHYLLKVLKESEKKNVLVVTHNTTKDDFGTKHEMNPADAKQFETILGTYKKKNKHVNIQVLFGHLHILQSWQKDGVKYTITGNGASKGYVTNDKGNILGSGILEVTNDGMQYKFNPLLTDVSIVDDALNEKRQMKIAAGAKRSLNLFGDFREITGNYIVNLSSFEGVNIKWFSDNEKAVKVSEDGTIQTVKRGTANITATSGGKSSTITVTVIDPDVIKPVNIEVNPNSEQVIEGKNIRLTATAIDKDGNRFGMNTDKIFFELSPPELAEWRSGKIKTKKSGTLNVAYQYLDIKRSLDIQILPKAVK